jgi:hypothetical protein
MTKIKLTTSGLPVGERTNLRKLDIDHALTIIEFTGRGYHVRATANEGLWSLSFYEAGKGKIFVNMPETTKEDDRNIFIRPYYGNDDGRLYDNQPDWQHKLIQLCRTAGGPNIHWH